MENKMKSLKLLATSLLTLLLAVNLFASQPPAVKKNLNMDLVEKNLLSGLEENNRGLAISSAQMLGELKSSKAVIPLMRILKSSNDEAARISAALSLYKIGDARGLYAVKQASKFDSSERVRKMTNKFYLESLR
jgi:HEAT repeat protein